MATLRTDTDTASTADVRDTLVPAISAATGALLAVALHPAFPVLGGITAAMAGAAAGMLLLRRHSTAPVSAAIADPRDGRIHDLEVALASERTMHEATKSQAALRQAEMERFLADMEMTRSMLEGQASQSV